MGKWKGEVKSLTTRQMIDCYDTGGETERMYKFAMYGLGLKSLDDFDNMKYTHTEISAIAIKVIEESNKGKNPTK